MSHLPAVKTAVMLRLADNATDQVISITAQGTDAAISMAIKEGTEGVWVDTLRRIADALEAGDYETEQVSYDAAVAFKPN